MRQPGPLQDELQAFAARVQALNDAGQPVKVQVGFGWTPAPGFLNLDVRSLLPPDDPRLDECDVFYFPYADMPWPVPDASIDFVCHEDFIEHISQRQQVCFLAETLRVLRDGGWHRVSTPCLNASMRRHSRFQDGMAGVYAGEWDNWEHVSLFTRHSLEETARMVGYRDVVFNQKNQGVSPHSRRDELRPDADRDPVFGNIFADLLKLGFPIGAQRRLELVLPLFNEAFYLASNADVDASVRAGWFPDGRTHYVNCGFAERRAPFALDPGWYARKYPQAALLVAQGIWPDFHHYHAAAGQALGNRPTP